MLGPVLAGVIRDGLDIFEVARKELDLPVFVTKGLVEVVLVAVICRELQ